MILVLLRETEDGNALDTVVRERRMDIFNIIQPYITHGTSPPLQRSSQQSESTTNT